MRMNQLAVLVGMSFCLSVASAQLVIGQTTGVTGQAAGAVKENMYGAKLYFDHINSKGGVNGQPIELITLDDEYKPKKAGENAEKLITEKNVLALFMSKATPHSEAILPHLAKYKLALVGPSTGAMVFHEPVNPYVFNIRTAYQLEAASVIQQLRTMNLEKIGVAYVDDSFGKDVIIGLNKGLAQYNAKPVVTVPVNRDKPDFADMAAKLIKADPQAVVWIGSLGNVADGMKTVRKAGGRFQMVTLSNLATPVFIKELGEYARGVIVSQVFPSEKSRKFALMKEAADLAKAAKGADISGASMEGYASAKVMVEALRLAGPKPTRERILGALNGMRNYDLGGLTVSYTPEDHTGLNYTDLSIINFSGRFER